MVDSVTYLGHQIDPDGLHLLSDKVQAVKDAPNPQNVHEFKAYLGLLTYYGKFLPDLLTVLAPLYKLLRKDTCWRWAEEERGEEEEGLLLPSLWNPVWTKRNITPTLHPLFLFNLLSCLYIIM